MSLGATNKKAMLLHCNQAGLPFFFFLRHTIFIFFYFVLEYNRLTMLFQVDSKGTQSRIYMYPFSSSFYPGKMRTQKIPLQQGLWSCTFNSGTFLLSYLQARMQNRVKEVNSTHQHQMACLGWKEFQNWKLTSSQHWFKWKHLGKKCSYQNFSGPWKQVYNMTLVIVFWHEEE